MTPEAINAAIADFTGLGDQWLLIKRGYYWRPDSKGYTSRISEAGRYTLEEANRLVSPRREVDGVTKERAPTPLYTEDRNAMHEAICSLSGLQMDLFADILCEIVKPHRIEGYDPKTIGAPSLAWPGLYELLTATVAQLAEAFLRTIGKWEGYDTEPAAGEEKPLSGAELAWDKMHEDEPASVDVPTPRVDAAAVTRYVPFGNCGSEAQSMVHASFARTLERETIAQRALIGEAAHWLEKQLKEADSFDQRIASFIAKLKGAALP
ncbi:MAG: hypothetical protein JWO08_2353 [Verrucomicrobiaceae bacterium]|nr:hypothetical protein [Verrucomicrobiaceae bacterium]